jgi:predicted nucleic acid-binding protein
VPVGVPVSVAERCRSVSVQGVAWRKTARIQQQNCKSPSDRDLRLAPVTPEAAGEVLQGVRDEPAANDVERQLLKLEVFETGGVDLAREAARNYRTLRGRGHTVRKTIDCLIATFCIRERHLLLHRDRDFDPFEMFLELSVIHP